MSEPSDHAMKLAIATGTRPSTVRLARFFEGLDVLPVLERLRAAGEIEVRDGGWAIVDRLPSVTNEPLTNDYLRAIKGAIDDALPGQVALAQSGRGPMRGDFFAAARRLLAEVERLRGVAAEATKVERDRCLNICTFIKRHATGWEMRQAIRAQIESGIDAWRPSSTSTHGVRDPSAPPELLCSTAKPGDEVALDPKLVTCPACLRARDAPATVIDWPLNTPEDWITARDVAIDVLGVLRPGEVEAVVLVTAQENAAENGPWLVRGDGSRRRPPSPEPAEPSAPEPAGAAPRPARS